MIKRRRGASIKKRNYGIERKGPKGAYEKKYE